MVDSSKGFKNVLPNTYIPVIHKKDLISMLGRLPKISLLELMCVWPKIESTQPQVTKSKQKKTNEIVTNYARDVKSMKTGRKVLKRKVIDKILFEFWPKGLNLLQLSQVDCQLIVDRPNAYYWNLSTVFDSRGKEVPIVLDPKKFLKIVAEELSNLYMTYIYVCRHPRFPLIIIRVQVFDIPNIDLTLKRPHISSRKPYFLAIPINSPHIIHSPGNDLVTNIVLQVVERCLPQNPGNLLRISKKENQVPIRSLESMHILNGSSRFGNSLGIWTPYADGTVDIHPLGKIEEHITLKGPSEDDNELSLLEKTANMRFKGSLDGKLKSERLYDDNREMKSKKRSLYFDDEDDDNYEENTIKNEYASITPIQYAEFNLKNKIGSKYSSIQMKLTGMDVFAGLHELSVKHDDILNPIEVPRWITGEEGTSCGTVKDGKFYKYNS